jgi:hypothetical protein
MSCAMQAEQISHEEFVSGNEIPRIVAYRCTTEASTDGDKHRQSHCSTKNELQSPDHKSTHGNNIVKTIEVTLGTSAT